MKLLDKAKVEEMLAVAAQNPRLRINFNFHPDGESEVQRLCIAALPGTPFHIQRHPHSWEMLCFVHGTAKVRLFDDAGKLSQELLFGTGENLVMEIPAGVWHQMEVLTPCVFYEVKRGAYRPVGPEDTLNP